MRSMRETIVPTGRGAKRWMEFDADWYRRIYAIPLEIEDALADYLANGGAARRSPNVFFDEAWYLRRYPDVAQSVSEGNFASGFDHYCRDGLHRRSPHWLFDVDFYEAGSPDITPDALTGGGFTNAYDHFLRAGSAEGRLGHPLFDPRFYAANSAPEHPTVELEKRGPFAEFLFDLAEGRPEIPTSLYFDTVWYCDIYPQASTKVLAGEFLGMLHHYLCNDAPIASDPLCDFSEAYYLKRYPDVAEAVEKNVFGNGYLHFLQKGVFELRSPASYIDLHYYWNQNDFARRDVQSGRMRDAFVHVLTVGIPRGLTLARYPAAPDIPEDQTRALFAAQAQSLLPLFGRRPIDFTLCGPPDCSVILALNNGFHLTLLTLASLRQNLTADNGPAGIELILIDNGSVDGVRQIERYVTGAKILRFDANVGFARACNAGLQLASADAVLFLNSDVRLASGAIAAALVRLRSDPTIGAVGGKVIRTNETVQEAGCIIWRDGWTEGYMRGQSPLAPETCFVRDVDFCSAVFLMARTSLLHQLGGFDDIFSPAYFEDADLGVRIWGSGHRVVYDPAIVLHHFEHGSSRDPRAAQALLRSRHKLFFDKHVATLRFRYAASQTARVFARAKNQHHRRILFIENTVPLRMRGSGYVRANDIIRTAAALGCHVTVFPIQSSDADLAEIYADFPDAVEVMYDRSVDNFRTFLEERSGFFDVIWVSRSHNLDLIRPILQNAALVPGHTRIILDTEAVVSTRNVLRAVVLGEPSPDDLREALRRECRNFYFCQQVLAVSDAEVQLLAGLGIPDVRLLGTMRELALTPSTFQERVGILFVGSLHAADTPNFDSLVWFIGEVLPHIEAALGYETRLTIAGFVAPGLDISRFADHSRVTRQGSVVELAPLYGRHRIVVAPTRFAAGTPYKVYEAAAFGVPVVVTTLLQDQLGWKDDTELLSAPGDDPVAFARQVVKLYRSEALWQRIRAGAAARIQRENGPDRFSRTLLDVLDAGEIRRDTASFVQ